MFEVVRDQGTIILSNENVDLIPDGETRLFAFNEVHAALDDILFFLNELERETPDDFSVKYSLDGLGELVSESFDWTLVY